MLFGRSIFQSVIDRLESESLVEQEPNAISPIKRQPYVTSDLLFDTKAKGDSDQQSQADPFSAYRDFLLDDEALHHEISQVPTSEHLAENLATGEEIAPETANAGPAKDYSYLTTLSPDEIGKELALQSMKSPADLMRCRRKFARNNHPDSVPEQYRQAATQRMTIANLLIDQALKDLTFRSRLGI